MNKPIHFGVHVPNFGYYGDPKMLVSLAREAEGAGWEGFFIWDHMLFDLGDPQPAVDPWVALAAIATQTERLRLGALITPLARRRPWKVARETVTLDVLSGGRLVFGAALGFPPDAEFEAFGEAGEDRTRAARLDEGLAIVAGLWSGRPFHFDGEHYTVKEVTFLPPSLQSPRIPVWIGGNWPNKPPFRRAARWDGVMPEKVGGTLLSPDELREVVSYVESWREASEPFDVVFGGYSSAEDAGAAAETVAAYAESGMTWWVERLHHWRGPFKEMRTRIGQGPPVN